MKMAGCVRWIAVAGCVLLASGPAMAAGKVCDAKKYGAKGDGTTKDTKAIQAAIDACTAAKRGGTVTLSGGTFVSAPIVLKDNVTLDVAAGATLLGSPDSRR